MKHMKKILALAMCGAMAAVVFTGCSNNGTTSGTSESGNVSGTITMTGSTSMMNLCEALKEVVPEAPARRNSGCAVHRFRRRH